MLRLLPLMIEVVLLFGCLIDAVQTPANQTRNLPRWVWILLILTVPYIGPIVWLFAGRPGRGVPPAGPAPTEPTWPTRDFATRPRISAPDDDPEFLSTLKKRNDHEAMLRKWEEDLRRREQGLHPDESDGEETH